MRSWKIVALYVASAAVASGAKVRAGCCTFMLYVVARTSTALANLTKG
jgi:hypothetical protein